MQKQLANSSCREVKNFAPNVRRILGFELVNVLVDDLQLCLSKKQRNLTNISKFKVVNGNSGGEVEGVEHVLPAQKEKLSTFDAKLHELDPIRSNTSRRSCVDCQKANRCRSGVLGLRLNESSG